MSNAPVVNKVEKSGLVTIDLEMFFPSEEIEIFDLADYLHMGLVLREKDFREALDSHDWSKYKDKIMAIYSSNDAIIASWAYMLVAVKADTIATEIHLGKPEEVQTRAFKERLERHNWSQYSGKKVLLKGCSGRDIPPFAYVYATRKLLPYVERLMYGEACSFVPVYRA